MDGFDVFDFVAEAEAAATLEKIEILLLPVAHHNPATGGRLDQTLKLDQGKHQVSSAILCQAGAG